MRIATGIPAVGFHRGAFVGAALPVARLGQTSFEWYQRAKAAVGEFEKLMVRVDSIANKTAREEIIQWVGSADDDSSPLYRYRSVLYGDIQADVEAYTPPNYGAYALERRQGRVEELEEVVEDLRDKVMAAEKQYGMIPKPPATPPPVISASPNLTVPLLVAGGAIALAVLIS